MSHFNFKQDYILENEVVLLRPLAREDFDHLKVFTINEPDLWQFSLLQANTLENLQKYIDIALEARDKEESYPFIVFDKRANAYAGSTRFYDMQLKNKSLQLGFTWYGEKYQGTGLNRHCKYLLLEFAFETMGMDRVEFRADNNNLRSINAMKSIGYTVEGVLRSNSLRPNGTRRGSIVLGILKDEWFGKIKDNLKQKL